MASFGPPPPLVTSDLVALLTRNFEDHWLQPILSDPSSFSVIAAYAAIFLRVQAALDENFEIGSYILSAPGAARATATVRLQRPSGAGGTIDASVRFLDERGMVWRPSAPFVVAASGGTQTIDVPISTERSGFFLNSFEPLAYQFLSLPFDPTFVVIPGVDPATNGASPFLDLHGGERDAPRSPGEVDDTYRHRILFLDDMVSPAAMSTAAIEVFDAFPATVVLAELASRSGYRPLVEPFQDPSQPAELVTVTTEDGEVTLRSSVFGSPAAYCDDVAYADDVHGHVVRDISDCSAWFDVQVPTPIDAGEPRLFADNGFLDDPLFGFPDLGPSSAIQAPLAALVDELDRKRAGGVRFATYVGVDVRLDRHPPDTAHGGMVIPGSWAQAGSDSPADLIQAVLSYDADASYARTVTGSGAATPSQPGDLLYTFPAPVVAPLAVRFVRLTCRARSVVAGGAHPQLRFVVGPSGGAVVRAGATATVDFGSYRPIEVILEQNPVTAAPWSLADIATNFVVGLANVAAAGPTDELRVSELVLEFVVSYG